MDLPPAGRQPALSPSRCIRHRRAYLHGQVLVSHERSQSGAGRESTSPARENHSRRSRPRAASRHCPHAAAGPATGPARRIRVTASVDLSAGSPLWPASGYTRGQPGPRRGSGGISATAKSPRNLTSRSWARASESTQPAAGREPPRRQATLTLSGAAPASTGEVQL